MVAFMADISGFADARVLVVGDLMIDEYLWGETDRISPEAPVPVVDVKKTEFTLGGAGNVVNNLVALGATVVPAGVIGDGQDGDRLLRCFDSLGVQTSGIIRETGRFTTRKTRILAAHQHVLRIDRETRKAISAQTFERLKGFVRDHLPHCDILLISDYGKGLLSKDFLAFLIEAAAGWNKKSVADPKGRDFSRYAGVFVLTPNQKEAALAAGMEISDEFRLLEAAGRILDTSGVQNLLITRGPEGMFLLDESRTVHPIQADARQVFDVSGAGDTVLAVLGLALCSGFSLKAGAALANTAAGIVVGKVGTATVSPPELTAALEARGDAGLLKQKRLAELPALGREFKRQQKRIVLTNGCFDLLHAGHIRLFSAARALGDLLVVAIDDDQSVRTLKGPGRPVIRAEERVRILSALDSVDYVVVFSSEQLPELIQSLQPDLLAKGSNYGPEDVKGHEIMQALGGEVALIPITEQISSSEIIQTIKGAQ